MARRLAEKSGSRKTYIPDRGDVVWISLTPKTGHEQSGRRPALVLSPRSYNAKVGLALMCPITSQIKGYPFEVPLPKGFPVFGVVLADQVRSLDWVARKATITGTLPKGVVTDVIERLQLLLQE